MRETFGWMRCAAKHIWRHDYMPRFSICNTCSVSSINVTTSSAHEQSRQHLKPLTERFLQVKSTFAVGGGDEALASHTQRNGKLFVGDRLALLFDKEEASEQQSEQYLELSSLGGLGMSYGDVPRAGVVAAIGKISGRLTLVLANDATVKGGTVFPITVRKQLRYLDLARQLLLPCIYVVDSGGAFLPLQADIFPDAQHGGRVFYNEAILSSLGVPQMSVVCGNCTAGGAYVPAMSDQMGMVHQISQLFLGGPPLVLAATGEVISAEDLGGATVHSRISGVSDHWFANEREAFTITRQVWDTIPQQINTHPNKSDPHVPLHDREELQGLLPNIWSSQTEDPLAAAKHCLMHIITRIVDKSHLVEFKSDFGQGLICGFARINGYMVGLIAGYGSLNADALTKGAHFVQICQHRRLPMVFLCHTSRNSSSTPSHDCPYHNEIKARSQFMFAVATARVPKISLIVGDAFGEDYYCLGAPCMNADFTFAWPNAEFGYTESENKDKILNAFQAAACIFIDDIILPENSRKCLSSALDICYTKLCIPQHDQLQFGDLHSSLSSNSSSLNSKTMFRF